MNPLLTLLLCEDCQNWEWKLSANYTQSNRFASKLIGTPSGERSVGRLKKRNDNKQYKKREREKRVLRYTYNYQITTY